MENNLNKIIHIEFYGLPGCGKSTISHIIAQELRTRGYVVQEPSYDFDHNLRPLHRKIKKMAYTVFFGMHYPDIYKKVKKIVVLNGYVSFKSYMSQLVNILPKLGIYKRNTGGIFFWDEGMIQSSISLAFQSGKDVNSIIRNFGIKKNNSILIKIDVNEKIAVERMNNRATNDSRVEKESNPIKKHEMLQKYQRCIEHINEDILVCNSKPINECEKYESIVEQIENKLLNYL